MVIKDDQIEHKVSITNVEEQIGKKADEAKEPTEDEVHELMLITYVEPDECDVIEPYKAKLYKLIQAYTPKKEVQSAI